MKVRLYLDVIPGLELKHLIATMSPGAKYEGCKRYALDIEVPDPYEPDAVIEAQQLQPEPRQGTIRVEEV